MIYCVMNTGGAISTNTSTLLFNTAKKLASRGGKSQKFADEHCFGVLSTQYKHSSMGTISGVEFKAELVVKGKESVVTFIVQGNWMDQYPEGWLGFKDQAALNRYVAETSVDEKPPRLN